MPHASMRPVLHAAGIAIAALLSGPALAQYLTPNVINDAGPIVNSLNGTTFTNLGLVGVGRIDASLLDDRGETFGSVSSMAMRPGSWAYDAASGVFTGTFLTLPDRGYNVPSSGSYSDYYGRIQELDFAFKPLASGATNTNQNQIVFNYKGMTILTEPGVGPTTGADPANGVGTAFGAEVPRAAVADGRISLDAEGLVALADGSYYVSDEYASSIYHFNAAGELINAINPPSALIPKTAGVTDFNSIAAPDTGRRNNQGMEGLSLSPDGKTLFAVNQSAVLQDNGPGNVGRKITRVLTYDVSDTMNPVLTGHFAVELPTFDTDGNGSGLDRTAAQSEVLALNDHQFLMLPRDGAGQGAPGTIMYKSVVLVDITTGTNLIGTAFEGLTPVAPGGVVEASIDLLDSVEVLNMLNLADLGRVGLNLDGLTPDANTLSEKWEGLSLAPALDTADPYDYFLFIANDNDFLSTNGIMKDALGNLLPYDAGVDNDTMFLAYRVQIVPEPGSALLALLAAGAVVTRRRRSA